MIDLRIIYDVDGWAFSHAARALEKHAPPGFRVATAPMVLPGGSLDPEGALGETEPDIVFAMPTRPEKPALLRKFIQARRWNPAIAGAWNCGWPLHAEALPERHAGVDALLMNNSIAWEQVRQWPRVHLCPNGVDLERFRVIRPIGLRTPRVLWCGSRYWQKVKGYDDLLLPLEQRLRSRGVECDFRLVDSMGPDKLTPAEMAEWYNTGTVLVCASVSEGTPNTALEAAACGCTIVSTPVGNMPELIESGRNGYLVERSLDALESGVLAALSNHAGLAEQLGIAIRGWGWEHRAPAFYSAFRCALEERSRRASGVSLR